MGRFYLPPHVVIFVAVLAAVGAVLTVLARPASGQERPPEVPSAPASVSAARGRGRARARRPRAASRARSDRSRPRARSRPQRRRPATGRRRDDRRSIASARAGRGAARRQTEFGSPTTLAVAAQRGRWLGVVTTHVANGNLGWVDPQESAVRTSRDARAHHDRPLRAAPRRASRRQGRPPDDCCDRPCRARRRPSGASRSPTSSPAPATARATAAASSLSRRTSRTCRPVGPAATGSPSTARTNPARSARAASAGCPRAGDADMRFLSRAVPLGAPVFVRA